MNGRFVFVGVVASLALHGVLLLFLSFGRSDDKSPPPSDSRREDFRPSAAENAPQPVEEPSSTPPDRTDASVPPPTRPVDQPVRSDRTEASTPEEWTTYVVKKGDTLTGLAKKAGCTVSEAARRNGKSVKDLANLKVGQRIRLPRTPES